MENINKMSIATYLHRLQHSFPEHLFNLYLDNTKAERLTLYVPD